MNERFDLDLLDLDSLIDASDVNIDDDLSINTFNDMEVIEEPHFKIATKDFKEFIKLAKYVVSNNVKDTVCKSVAMQIKDGKVIGYTTDMDVYLEYKMDLLNTCNFLEEGVCFPLDTIVTMLKALPSTTIILKDNEGFKIKLNGGRLPLDTHDIDINKFMYKDPIKESEVPTMDTKVFSNALRDFGNIAQAAIAINERCIIFNEHGIFASYMFSMTKKEGIFPKMDIKMKDLVILKNLTLSKDDSLLFYDVADETKSKRKVIKSDKFSYAFLISDLEMNKALLDMDKNTFIGEGLTLDFLQIYQLVNLSNELNYSLGKLGFNFIEGNKLEVAFKTKKGKDSLFQIDGISEGVITPLKTPLVVPSKFIKAVLSVFSKSDKIKMSLNENAIIIQNEDYVAKLFLAV